MVRQFGSGSRSPGKFDPAGLKGLAFKMAVGSAGYGAIVE